jgi:hypothetical protein
MNGLSVPLTKDKFIVDVLLTRRINTQSTITSAEDHFQFCIAIKHDICHSLQSLYSELIIPVNILN